MTCGRFQSACADLHRAKYGKTLILQGFLNSEKRGAPGYSTLQSASARYSQPRHVTVSLGTLQSASARYSQPRHVTVRYWPGFAFGFASMRCTCGKDCKIRVWR